MAAATGGRRELGGDVLTVEPFGLRPATRDDVAAISTMQKASLLETYEPFLGRVTVEEFIANRNVERYFAEHWRQATVATLGDEIVGVLFSAAPYSTSSG